MASAGTGSNTDMDKGEDEPKSSSSSSTSLSAGLATSEEVETEARVPGVGSRVNEASRKPRRLSRNVSEKMRRDKLNMHLQKLAKEVPIISACRKKLDKSSVLRLTVNYLKIYLGLRGKRKLPANWSCHGGNKEALGSVLQKALNGFFLIVSQSGSVIFVSSAVQDLLGHSQSDLVGRSFDDVVHPNDWNLFCIQFAQDDITGASSSLYRSFYIRVLSTLGRDSGSYSLVHFTGHLQTVCFSSDGSLSVGKTERWLMVAGKVMSQSIIQDIALANQEDEWISQHAMDGKILFSDPRCACITGRLFKETDGKSVYQYIHPADMDAVRRSHQKIMQMDSIPSTVFRLQLAGGQKVAYIQSRSCIARDRWTLKTKFIVSLNSLLSDEVGQELLNLQSKGIEEEEELQEQKRVRMPLSSVTADSSSSSALSVLSSMGELSSSGQEETFAYRTVATSSQGDILNVNNVLVQDTEKCTQPSRGVIQEVSNSRTRKRKMCRESEDCEFYPKNKSSSAVFSTNRGMAVDDVGESPEKRKDPRSDVHELRSSSGTSGLTFCQLGGRSVAKSSVKSACSHCASSPQSVPLASGAPTTASSCASTSPPTPKGHLSLRRSDLQLSPLVPSSGGMSGRNDPSGTGVGHDSRALLSSLLIRMEAVTSSAPMSKENLAVPSGNVSVSTPLCLKQGKGENLPAVRQLPRQRSTSCANSGNDEQESSAGGVTVEQEFRYFSSQVVTKQEMIAKHLALQKKLLTEIKSQLMHIQHLSSSPGYQKLCRRLLALQETKESQLRELETLKQTVQAQHSQVGVSQTCTAVLSPMQRPTGTAQQSPPKVCQSGSATDPSPAECLAANTGNPPFTLPSSPGSVRGTGTDASSAKKVQEMKMPWILPSDFPSTFPPSLAECDQAGQKSCVPSLVDEPTLLEYDGAGVSLLHLPPESCKPHHSQGLPLAGDAMPTQLYQQSQNGGIPLPLCCDSSVNHLEPSLPSLSPSPLPHLGLQQNSCFSYPQSSSHGMPEQMVPFHGVSDSMCQFPQSVSACSNQNFKSSVCSQLDYYDQSSEATEVMNEPFMEDWNSFDRSLEEQSFFTDQSWPTFSQPNSEEQSPASSAFRSCLRERMERAVPLYPNAKTGMLAGYRMADPHVGDGFAHASGNDADFQDTLRCSSQSVCSNTKMSRSSRNQIFFEVSSLLTKAKQPPQTSQHHTTHGLHRNYSQGPQ